MPCGGLHCGEEAETACANCRRRSQDKGGDPMGHRDDVRSDGRSRRTKIITPANERAGRKEGLNEYDYRRK